VASTCHPPGELQVEDRARADGVDPEAVLAVVHRIERDLDLDDFRLEIRSGCWPSGTGVPGRGVAGVSGGAVREHAALRVWKREANGNQVTVREATMRVTRIGWAGSRTDAYSDMVDFLTAVLGLTLERQERDFAVLDLPSGDKFEVFGPSDQDHQHFTTGPVRAARVANVAASLAVERPGVRAPARPPRNSRRPSRSIDAPAAASRPHPKTTPAPRLRVTDQPQAASTIMPSLS
jgi:hypothetical protein